MKNCICWAPFRGQIRNGNVAKIKDQFSWCFAVCTVIKCFIKGGVLLALDGKKGPTFLFFRPKNRFIFCEKSEPSWSCLIVNNKQFSLIAYLTLRFFVKKRQRRRRHIIRRTDTKKIPYVRKIFIYVNAFST